MVQIRANSYSNVAMATGNFLSTGISPSNDHTKFDIFLSYYWYISTRMHGVKFIVSGYQKITQEKNVQVITWTQNWDLLHQECIRENTQVHTLVWQLHLD